MTTFGYKVASACDDSTVDIYDSITGVLRLSLRLEDPAQALVGSPDGSVLFCAHNIPSVTVWDIQTGGLVHTFHFGSNAEDIGISLNGRYLACRLSDRSAEVREIANNTEGAATWTRSPVSRFCWLKPEGRLAVSTGISVDICDVVAGTVLRKHTVWYPTNCMAYSQTFDQLTIIASSANKSVITTINNESGLAAPPNWFHTKIRRFAFSQTTQELVCGMEVHGLSLFNFSTRDSKYFDYPNPVTSVSSLKNRTVVVNSAGSGIQLLSLTEGHTPSQKPTISALTVEAFDEGRIIAVYPTSRDHVILLDSTNMSQLLKTPTRRVHMTVISRTTVLCTSYKDLKAVYSFERRGEWFLELWRFHEKAPRWTVRVEGVPEIGRISLDAAHLVTFHAVDSLGCVCVWSTQDGILEAQLKDIPPPLDIEFTSDTEFCSYYGDHKRSHTFHSQKLDVRSENIPPSSPSRLQKRRYLDVDDNHEWVVRGPKKICWIPPGYIGPTQSGYCWAGSSFVMVGRNGTLRSLTFLDDYPEE